jgi:hypothetical protein
MARAYRAHAADAALALVFAGMAAAGYLAGAARINSDLVLTGDLWNVWFDGDPSVYYVSMTNRVSAHWGANVHPMLAFYMYPPVFGLTRVLGLSKPLAAQVWMACVAGAWVAANVVLARVLGCGRRDAALLGALAGVSSSAMFMFVVPEFHPFSAVTVTLGLVAAALLRERTASMRVLIAINALSASAMITNWSLGALTALQSVGLRRALAAVLGAAALLMSLSFVQRLAFPSASWFLLGSEGYAVTLWRAPSIDRLAHYVPGFLVHPVVMPAIGGLDPDPERPVGSDRWRYRALSVQRSAPGSASVTGAAAGLVWVGVLAAGVAAWYRRHRQWLVLPAAVGIQAGLYLIVGDETFLYALNWLPLLLAFVALALADARRATLRVLVAALVVLAAWNNVSAFRAASEMLREPGRFPALVLSNRS